MNCGWLIAILPILLAILVPAAIISYAAIAILLWRFLAPKGFYDIRQELHSYIINDIADWIENVNYVREKLLLLWVFTLPLILFGFFYAKLHQQAVESELETKG